HDQLSAIRRGGACETIGAGEVRAEVGGGVELDGRCLHLIALPFASRVPTHGNRLTSQSTLESIAPERPGESPARDRLPLLRAGRPLKRWRYVGVFCEELMACAAHVRVGPAQQSFWAVYLRGEDELYERTRLLPRRRELRLDPGCLSLHDRDRN